MYTCKKPLFLIKIFIKNKTTHKTSHSYFYSEWQLGLWQNKFKNDKKNTKFNREINFQKKTKTKQEQFKKTKYIKLLIWLGLYRKKISLVNIIHLFTGCVWNNSFIQTDTGSKVCPRGIVYVQGWINSYSTHNNKCFITLKSILRITILSKLANINL